MTTITLNGERRELPQDCTLADLVAAIAEAPASLATAVNQEFVPRGARAACVLREGDVVLTFQPITGG